MKKIWSFISEHGYGFMLAGMGIVVIAGIMLMRTRQAGGFLGPYVWPVALAGLGIYILGRVGIALKSAAGRKKAVPGKPDSHGDAESSKEETT